MTGRPTTESVRGNGYGVEGGESAVVAGEFRGRGVTRGAESEQILKEISNAYKNHNFVEAKELVERLVEINDENRQSRFCKQALLRAIRYSDVNTLRYLVEEVGVDLKQEVGARKLRPLQYAILRVGIENEGYLEVIKFLLDNKADPNYGQDDASRPLCLALTRTLCKGPKNSLIYDKTRAVVHMLKDAGAEKLDGSLEIKKGKSNTLDRRALDFHVKDLVVKNPKEIVQDNILRGEAAVIRRERQRELRALERKKERLERELGRRLERELKQNKKEELRAQIQTALDIRNQLWAQQQAEEIARVAQLRKEIEAEMEREDICKAEIAAKKASRAIINLHKEAHKGILNSYADAEAAEAGERALRAFYEVAGEGEELDLKMELLNSCVNMQFLEGVRYITGFEDLGRLIGREGVLHYALSRSVESKHYYDIFNTLLETGADVNRLNEDGRTPLSVLMCWGRRGRLPANKDADDLIVRNVARRLVEAGAEKLKAYEMVTDYGYPRTTAAERARELGIEDIVIREVPEDSPFGLVSIGNAGGEASRKRTASDMGADQNEAKRRKRE